MLLMTAPDIVAPSPVALEQGHARHRSRFSHSLVRHNRHPPLPTYRAGTNASAALRSKWHSFGGVQ